jgi:hypothetical protein
MLGGMASADDDAPAAAAEDELHAIAQGVVAVGKRQNAPLVMAAAGDPRCGKRLRREAGDAIHIGHKRVDSVSCRTAPLIAEAPFGIGHPELDAETLDEPAGEADTVGMVMRADEARDRFAVELGRKNLLPERLGLRVVDAAIDDRPAERRRRAAKG